MIGKTIFNRLKEKYQVGEKFRILFCPYKDEMWDSMESVYASAMNDPQTETEVMPIPYFTLQSMLPDKAKMDFYDYQMNFPESLNKGWDVIFFHYPYDNLNNVTRPMITSFMLKFFCRNLVFCNYAVIGNRDIKPEVCKAHSNADLIICENDSQAAELKELMVNMGIKGNEVVGWGSPKYDSLTVPQFCPAEWHLKAKGKRKILYQTSIIPYMKNPKRLSEIIATIKRLDKPENCIIWRPHPLFEETIVSHRKSELKAYRDLVDMFKNSRHIYDDTQDFKKAFWFSDEMVSDDSSLVPLYEYTGKPITKE